MEWMLLIACLSMARASHTDGVLSVLCSVMVVLYEMISQVVLRYQGHVTPVKLCGTSSTKVGNVQEVIRGQGIAGRIHAASIYVRPCIWLYRPKQHEFTWSSKRGGLESPRTDTGLVERLALQRGEFLRHEIRLDADFL